MSNATVSEQWLLDRYRRDGDTAAREELVRRLAPLVNRVAGTHSAIGHEDDLRQVAWLGLTKAIDRYDRGYGVPLRAYAVPTMVGEVRRYLRDHSWAVRVPRPLQERVLAVTKAVDRLTASEGRSPTAQQLADDLGLGLAETLEALEAGIAYAASSLDAPLVGVDDADATLADVLGRDDERLDRAEAVASLHELRPLLDDRDREVLYLRFVEDLTQTEIARSIGCSQMQVSRLLRRALDRLSDRALRTSKTLATLH
jgi:RNA polymerase sigma-B factor